MTDKTALAQMEIEAIKIEVIAMVEENKVRAHGGFAQAYQESTFLEAAAEIRDIIFRLKNP